MGPNEGCTVHVVETRMHQGQATPLIDIGDKKDGFVSHDLECSESIAISTESSCSETTALIKSPPKKSQDVQGLSVAQGTFFIVAEIAGSGLLTLPRAIEDAGWIGIPLILFCCITCAYTGIILTRSWNIYHSRMPEEERGRKIRYPYPALAKAAYGKYGGFAISFCINFTLFGGCVVFLLLAANNINKFVEQVFPDVEITYCLILVILSTAVFPVCLCGTPKDFWVIPVLGMSATTISMVLLLTVILMDVPDALETSVEHSSPTFTSFSSSFGIICFAFTGHSIFLTIQADMKVGREFPRALIYGYIWILLIYLPVPAAGYFIYGKALSPNILETITAGPVLSVVQVAFTLHIIMAFIILMNPVCQEIEAKLRVSTSFSCKRVLIRVIVMLCIMFVAATFPDFGSILSLIGGSAITVLTYVFPSLVYLKLAGMRGQWQTIYVPLHVKVINLEIIFMGAVTAIFVTYFSVQEIIRKSFHSPCYINQTTI